ncbi:MAG: putative ABC transporter permease [Clostridia bacterium]|nr:putative ABC transporter permease [Clostridia bacterium]
MEKNMELKNEEKLQKIEYYLFIFIITSMCGWVMELIYSSIALHRLNIPGFLFGPYIPLYGMGTVIIIALCDDKSIFKKIGKIFVLTTTLEYVISIALEIVVHRKWWDYSNNFLNINGRVCLLYSTYWVVLGLAILKFIKPLFERIYNKIKSEKTTKLIKNLMLVMAVDLMLSVIRCI